jgi:restriction endonuclease Mrr
MAEQVQLPKARDMKRAMLEVMASSKQTYRVHELEETVAKALKLTSEQLGIMRTGKRSEFSYRLAWERTHAKNRGLILKTAPSTWKITDDGARWIAEAGI